ncbi:MAG: hypothetical protein AAF662_01625 [Pseudomonadota bacterium]
MKDVYGYIAGEYHKRIDCITNQVDLLAPAIETACDVLMSCVVGDHKIVLCGIASDAELARYFAVSQRTGGVSNTALPCLAVAQEASSGESSQWQTDLRALCRDGDVVCLLDSSGDNSLVSSAIELCVPRNVNLILLSDRQELSQVSCIPLMVCDGSMLREQILQAGHCLFTLLQRRLIGG